jgi:hypothetical protein
MQLLQFEEVDKAMTDYLQLLVEYPQSEFAPKAAYAVAYIYERILKDAVKATEAYQNLIRDYPDTQQAAMAREALGLPPVERPAVQPQDVAVTADSTVVADSTGREGPEQP